MDRYAAVYQVVAYKRAPHCKWVNAGFASCLSHRDLRAYHLNRYVIGITDCVWMVPGTWAD